VRRRRRKLELVINKAMSVKFSNLEMKLLALVPFDEPVNTTELLELYFGDDPPLHARQILTDRLNRISTKAEKLGLNWRINKTKRSGPIPQSFWRTHAVSAET
jgi:hypothetical protein